ncbi:Na(+)/H(+) antiporter subunit C [Streptomyces gardneri]|jgi:multicomponent Na+:H+ antiporter subunit C|uniref:Na(+)/H(+) antiporter subunit C n=1 Tax=Nocardia TaxID=1817 RepID=UPI00135A9FCE|nr:MULTISPECIES: Na(+)/H(+) antiporter subunit C [Nocardia]MBF6163964.1 Na(+)/H(+) antiporter subunit C [Streptomyces gardneri]MBF6203540.1 Na(+)/H(+) antiporter subunit C [Streptomyces gardneri]UAK33600.1 Na(+)/H(+) antiporter subunit C [Nocardia asteroides]
MTVNLTLLVVIGILVACGVYLILERAVSKMLLGLILFGNAVNLLILTAGGGDGKPPIRGEADVDEMADPLAQAMVLTAIVITMGIAAFVLALAYRAYTLTTSDDVADDQEDADVARRRAGEDPET